MISCSPRAADAWPALATGTVMTPRLLVGEFAFVGTNVIMMGNLEKRGRTGNERTQYADDVPICVNPLIFISLFE